MANTFDTTGEAEQVRLAAIRALCPATRLQQALDWSESVRSVVFAALKRRHPDFTDRAIVELLHRNDPRATLSDRPPP